MKVNKRNNKGISLIVLVITIIIMIILAGAIILSLSGTGLITNANKSAFQSDISTMQEELGVYIANKITETKGKYTQDTLFASKDNLEENGEKIEEKNIKDVLTSIDKKYLDEVEIINGKVVYVGGNLNKLKWANEILLGVKKELKESTSETEKIMLEESANLNLVDCKIYGNTAAGESSVGDYVIDLGFDNKWLQGAIYGDENNYNTRIRIANYIKSEAGVTYTISSNLPGNMQILLYNGTFTTYPFNYSEAIYNSGWNEDDITFTSEIDGNITMSIRYRNSANISPEDVKDYEVKVEMHTLENEGGKYKIPIHLSGKNLVNVKGLNYSYTKAYGQYGITQTRTEKVNGGYDFPIPTIKANTPIYFSFDFVDSSDYINYVNVRPYDLSDTRLSGKQFTFKSGGGTTKWESDINKLQFYTMSADPVGTFYTIDNLMIRTEGDDVFEPYIAPKTYAIYLDEPLRKVGEYVDYIDFRTQKVVRNVEEVNGELRGLSTPKVEKVSIPNILLERRTSIIKVNTNISPSKIETLHYQNK